MQWHGMANEPMRKAFHWNAPHICFVVYVILHVPNTDFFNIVHLSVIVRHVKCNFLIVFIHICNLRGLYLSWYSYLYIFFVCICFLQIVGEVIWHGRWCPFPHWEAFYWYGPKIIFAVCILLYLPKTFVEHHEFCGNCKPYNMYIPLWLFYKFHVCMVISVYFLIFLHIFFWECLA